MASRRDWTRRSVINFHSITRQLGPAMGGGGLSVVRLAASRAVTVLDEERKGMSNDPKKLAGTVRAMRPIVPARDFDISERFYVDLGFEPERLAERLVEMHLGTYAFILQNYYVEAWADNFVMHLRVSDVRLW
jgi:hypothetical protein